MKLEVGMYVRLQNDAENIVIINRIANVFETTILTENDGSIYQGEYTKENVIKADYKIIKILEIGDILVDDTNRKLEVLLIDNELMVRNTGLIYDNNYYLPIKSIAIKSVITHEQMEQMAFKVEE
jgi:hypothetical protein